MRFEHPDVLWLVLLIVPALGAFFCWAWIKKRRLILQFVQSRLLAQLTVGVSTGRQKTRLVLAIVATAFILFSLSRPQWGFDWEEARQRGLDIVVAIDTSRSMMAEDVSPNRLKRAKLAALDLKKLARSDRLGLVAFAGSAFLQCPLSVDDQAFQQSLDALDVSIIPQGGTAVSEAIRSATTAFKKENENHKILVIFTDGEDHDGEALKAAEDAAEAGLRIFTIGVGSANGELLRITDPSGRIDYVKDEKGQVVKSRLNEQLLRQIAQAADGFYMLLSGANTIDVLYERGLEPLPKSEFGTRQLKRHHERFQWFLSFGLVLLFVEMFFPEQKRTQKAGAATPADRIGKIAGLLLLFLALPSLTLASPGKALKNYQAGKYAAAQLQYERALEDNPSDPRLEFNVGAAAFQSKAYDAANKHLNAALVTEDVKLQQRAYYNLGNTNYRMGEDLEDMNEKKATWEQAISHYESAIKLNSTDENARHNLNFVKKRLEELKQEQQKDDQNKDQEKKDEEGEDQEKKDQEKKDGEQKDQENKEGSEQDQNQEQQQQGDKSEEEKKKEQQQQEQAQKDEDQEKKDQEQAEAGKEGEENDDPSEQQGSPQEQKMIRLTPQQAMQLLDAQRSEERPMIFAPPKKPRPNNRPFKDW